jgi:uncharacterized protein (UPF0333 family)
METKSVFIIVVMYVLATILIIGNGEKVINKSAVEVINDNEPIVCSGKKYDNYIVGSEFVFVGVDAKEVFLKKECNLK